jgi:hypothetical protein
MAAILIAEAPECRQAAQLVIVVADRLSQDALAGVATPFVFEALTEEGATRSLNPTPLPTVQARES